MGSNSSESSLKLLVMLLTLYSKFQKTTTTTTKNQFWSYFLIVYLKLKRYKPNLFLTHIIFSVFEFSYFDKGPTCHQVPKPESEHHLYLGLLSSPK